MMIMASSKGQQQVFVCHFCFVELFNHDALIAHFPICSINNKSLNKQKGEKCLRSSISSPPKLDQKQLDLLRMLKLHRSNNMTFNFESHINNNSQPNLILPLSCSFSRSHLLSPIHMSLVDTSCDNSDLNELLSASVPIDDNNSNENDQRALSNSLTNKLSTFHTYKYSRRERHLFYASVKRAILKKNFITKKSRKEPFSTVFFNRQDPIPLVNTNIGHRPRSNPNNSMYPLLFDPHFNTLVQMPSDHSSILLNPYLSTIQINHDLLHSIASQEFQIVVHSDDRRHCFSHSSSLFIHTLRQCMLDYATNIQTTYKRNYLATFQHEQDDEESTGETESFVPPPKIRRFHSCEKNNHRMNSSTFYPSSSSATSSSSSGMSIIQVNHGQPLDEQQRLNGRPKRVPVRTATRLGENQRFLPIQTNGNGPSTHTSLVSFADVEKQENIETQIIPILPIQPPTVPIVTQRQTRERTATDPFLFSSTSVNEQLKTKKSTSPIFIREQISEPLPKYQSVHLSDGARIRIVNCSNDNKSTRISRDSTIKKSSSTMPITVDRGDENWATKSTRIHTRHISTTINPTKHPDLLQLLPPYQPKPVVLLPTEMSQGWLTHSVFYRCHACAHEEFFVVPSRECMNLHISSKHSNMEENFKQRISNFRNNQGRALRIFQHFLKWQQPWSETEIDRLFQLANILPSNLTDRINGEITNLTNKAN